MSLQVDIEKQLGDFHLNVRFEADREAVALLGASGCGKSLTLRCIAGILTPDRGRIVLNGKTLFDSSEGINLPPQKRHVGFLFQQYALFPNMTVWQNIAAAVPKKEQSDDLVEELLHRLRLTELSNLRPAQLSGGQQQRTALARILASSPEIILLDEPLSALDSYLRYQVELELSETLKNFNGPVVWVSHDRGEAFRNCPMVCVLDHGASTTMMTREALMKDPHSRAAASLAGCQNFVHVVPQGSHVFVPEWNVSLDCGREVPAHINMIGIFAHDVAPGQRGFPCFVESVIEDINSVIFLLKPKQSEPKGALLRMELPKKYGRLLMNIPEVTIEIKPSKILLLEE